MSDSRALSPMTLIANTLQAPQMQAMLKQALPKDVTVDRFTRTTMTAIQTNPDVVNWDRQSLYNAIVRCAEYGLMPDGKQAAIVKFNTKVVAADGERYISKAQAMPMVEGIIHIMGKAGVPAYADSVYANDVFELWSDESGQHVKHVKTKFGQPRGERLGAYAVARTREGWVYVEAMTMEDLEIPKRATKQKDRDGNLIGPWRDTPDRMEQKSCLHRLAKRVPSLALRDDDEFSDGEASAPPPVVKMAEPPQQEPQAESPKSAGEPARPKSLQKIVDSATEAEIVGEQTENPAPPQNPSPPTPSRNPATPDTAGGTAAAETGKGAAAPATSQKAGAEKTAGGPKTASQGAQQKPRPGEPAKPAPKPAATIQGGEVF